MASHLYLRTVSAVRVQCRVLVVRSHPVGPGCAGRRSDWDRRSAAAGESRQPTDDNSVFRRRLLLHRRDSGVESIWWFAAAAAAAAVSYFAAGNGRNETKSSQSGIVPGFCLHGMKKRRGVNSCFRKKKPT